MTSCLDNENMKSEKTPGFPHVAVPSRVSADIPNDLLAWRGSGDAIILRWHSTSRAVVIVSRAS